MVWGGIFFGRQTKLHVCDRNMTDQIKAKDIIDNIVENYQANLEPGFCFLDDNARSHRVGIVANKFEMLGIDRLPFLFTLARFKPYWACLRYARAGSNKAATTSPQRKRRQNNVIRFIKQGWPVANWQSHNEYVPTCGRGGSIARCPHTLLV